MCLPSMIHCKMRRNITMIAASIAVAIALLPAQKAAAPAPGAEQRVQLASASDPSMDSFAMLYTVSDEEEYYL